MLLCEQQARVAGAEGDARVVRIDPAGASRARVHREQFEDGDEAGSHCREAAAGGRSRACCLIAAAPSA